MPETVKKVGNAGKTRGKKNLKKETGKKAEPLPVPRGLGFKMENSFKLIRSALVFFPSSFFSDPLLTHVVFLPFGVSRLSRSCSGRVCFSKFEERIKQGALQPGSEVVSTPVIIAIMQCSLKIPDSILARPTPSSPSLSPVLRSCLVIPLP